MRHKLRGERKFDASLADMDAHGACFLDIGGDSAPAAPDYTPVAQASEEAARVSAAQADRVLAESTRQYERNMEVAQPIIDAQVGMMKSAKDQGNEYFDYWKTKARPVEDALNTEAMATGTEAKQNVAVDRAVADSQGGYTRALNQGFRQAKRYGIAPIATTGAIGLQQAQNTAAAATGARDKEKALGTAKKLDVAGLYRGMPGASQGAYASAINAGNSAVNNSTTVGNGVVAGTNAAAGLTMQGQGMKVQGLGNILSNQTSYANSAPQDNSMAGLGSMLGGAAAVKTAFFAGSSKKIKHDKEPIDSESVLEAIDDVPVEKWTYNKGVEDSGTHIGPYAEDMNAKFGDNVAPGGAGLDLVSANGINMAAIKGLSSKVRRLEGRVAGLSLKKADSESNVVML